MVEIKFYKINKNAQNNVGVFHDRIIFKITKPTVIQPSEIIKVKTGIVMKVPNGHIVIISTPQELANQACELFPNVSVVDAWAKEEELELAIRNSGRGQVNLMADTVLAEGHLSKINEIGIGDYELAILADPPPSKTKPQKKNPFEFEVK